MKLFKWAYGILAIVTTICLVVSFFVPSVNPFTQISLLIQAVGFGWICGCATGIDM